MGIEYALHEINHETHEIKITDGIAPEAVESEIQKALGGLAWVIIGLDHWKAYKRKKVNGLWDSALFAEVYAAPMGTIFYKFKDYQNALYYAKWAKEHGLDLEMIGLNANRLTPCLFQFRYFHFESENMIANWRDIDFTIPRRSGWFELYKPYEPIEKERW